MAGEELNTLAHEHRLKVEYAVICMEPARLSVVLLIFLTLNLKAAVA